jgi:hypothetical protein
LCHLKQTAAASALVDSYANQRLQKMHIKYMLDMTRTECSNRKQRTPGIFAPFAARAKKPPPFTSCAAHRGTSSKAMVHGSAAIGTTPPFTNQTKRERRHASQSERQSKGERAALQLHP